MRTHFEGTRTFIATMSAAVMLGGLCAAAPARAQDTDAQDMGAPNTTTSTQTTTTHTTNTPEGTRAETRTTQGQRQATSSAPPAPEPARVAEPPPESRHDILWIEAIGGYSFVNMRALKTPDNFFPSVVELTGSGFAAGLAVGLRFTILTIGARATLASYPGFEVGTAGAEVTLRLPTPVVEPWIRAGFGYGWLGSADYHDPAKSETSVYGYVIQAAVGVDIYLGKVVSIGGGFDLDILNLSRQPFTGDPALVAPITEVDLTQDGNAVGLQIRGHGTVTFHF